MRKEAPMEKRWREAKRRSANERRRSRLPSPATPHPDDVPIGDHQVPSEDLFTGNSIREEQKSREETK
jgi:hypothetical protein